MRINLKAVDALVHLARQPLKNQHLENLPKADAPERVNYYRFLYHCVKQFQPSLAIEIGVERGYASAFMCKAAQNYGGHVIGIDINAHPFPARDLPAQVGNYTFIHGDATTAGVWANVAELVEYYGPIGLVYQDSSHHYRASINEWQTYSPLMQRPGLWICDDITPAFHDPKIDPPGKGMVQYFEGLPGEKKLYPDVLHRGNTQGVVIVE